MKLFFELNKIKILVYLPKRVSTNDCIIHLPYQEKIVHNSDVTVMIVIRRYKLIKGKSPSKAIRVK